MAAVAFSTTLTAAEVARLTPTPTDAVAEAGPALAVVAVEASALPGAVAPAPTDAVAVAPSAVAVVAVEVWMLVPTTVAATTWEAPAPTDAVHPTTPIATGPKLATATAASRVVTRKAPVRNFLRVLISFTPLSKWGAQRLLAVNRQPVSLSEQSPPGLDLP
ncbi:MAG: hypothetical protein ACRDIF_07870 [Actinomycetota bacterium]